MASFQTRQPIRITRDTFTKSSCLKITCSETLESVFYFGLCCTALKDRNSLTRGGTLALAMKAPSPNHWMPRNSLESAFSTRKRLRRRHGSVHRRKSFLQVSWPPEFPPGWQREGSICSKVVDSQGPQFCYWTGEGPVRASGWEGVAWPPHTPPAPTQIHLRMSPSGFLAKYSELKEVLFFNSIDSECVRKVMEQLS